MAWDRELEVLEEAIRRLGAEYDAFLYGTATKPPVESRKHVEQMIRRLSGVSLDAAAERYRFATLQGRYTTLTERWERLQGEKESGRRPGLYGHFVPGADRPHAAGPVGSAPGNAPNAAGSGSVERPGVSAGADRQLFETYLGARKARGESVEGYDFQKFAQSLARERARLKERLGTEDVVFEVAEREGRVKLIARRGPAEGDAPPGGKK
ncbi:MAG: MXAN_5187 C-terminal domain-containing protein [Acidobacteriota bacterium]